MKKQLRNASNIMVLCHANPDGDAIGSLLGTYHALKSLGLSVTPGCYDPVPDNMKFLPGSDKVISEFEEQDYDTYILLDCGHQKMLKYDTEKPYILSEQVQKINVDHHPTNDNFGDANFVITQSASTTQILYFLFKELEMEINPTVATCLLLGLYTDTGSFMHQNTTPETYQVASQLVRSGGNAQSIANNIFRNYNFRTLKLWGKVLENLHITSEGAAIVGVEREDYESIGATRQDLNGIIDIINSMPEAKYCVLLSEDDKGNVKASLRTRKEDMDMRALAEQFGGGGHVKASGFTIPGGKLEKEVRWKIVKSD
ncbi:MAG TPA: bifunctional oligoribonuclease/PAP phosphatase NrnA [Candidatus Gracilibacteria bacterium]